MYGFDVWIDGKNYKFKVVDKEDRDTVVDLMTRLEETGKHGDEVIADYQELD